MQECTKIHLRRARDNAHLTRMQAAPLLGVSESTLKNWENPSHPSMPTLSDVSRMEDIYGADGLWWCWARSNDDASRDRLPPLPALELQGAILSTFAEMGDLIALQQDLMRDGADGKINNPDLLEKGLKEAGELVAASYLLYCQLKRQKEQKGG